MQEDILAELRLELQSDKLEKIGFNKSSLLQGVIMESIDTKYAQELHEQILRPYSQYIRYENGKNIWYIKALNYQAYDGIIKKLLNENFQRFILEHNETEVRIIKKDIRIISKKTLFEEFYSSAAKRTYMIEFKTPTAFKKDGKYFFWPDISNIYGSLMRKYDATSEESMMEYKETFEQLVENTHIVSYNLNTTNFSLEGIRIPSFMGNIVVHINGPQTMVNFARMLFEFGEYSGIGIKTAIGMGCVQVTEGKVR